jgi:hypothetical protein
VLPRCTGFERGVGDVADALATWFLTRKAAHIRRIELRLTADDPMRRELEQEAQLRGVELTHHIYDLLRSRYLLRHGQSFQDLLWVPGGATIDVPAATPAPDPELAAAPSATAAAAAWVDLLGMEAT